MASGGTPSSSSAETRSSRDQGRSDRHPRARRDGDRRGRERDGPRRRDGDRGDRSRATAWCYARVSRSRVRVAVPAEGTIDVHRPRRACTCGRRRDRRFGPQRQRIRRRARLDVTNRQRDAQPHRHPARRGGGGPMKTGDLLIAVNTVWVVVAAVLVMFMQAGFAFLEAGLTRMKNAAHIAGKNVLIFGICSLVYWPVGFALAFGDGDGVL